MTPEQLAVLPLPAGADRRRPIPDQVKRFVDEALLAIPADRRAAMLVIADQGEARVHVAAKYGEHWKVAASGSRTWRGEVAGQVAIVGSW